MKIIELENIPYDEDALSMLLFTTDVKNRILKFY